mmetsp:Transcript_20732/g.26962  ORF Transcript_20732/g.26962 Transcript_20732/m.26962 type:complete len:658 (-) Transcript_20732:136-2109(-)
MVSATIKDISQLTIGKSISILMNSDLDRQLEIMNQKNRFQNDIENQKSTIQKLQSELSDLKLNQADQKTKRVFELETQNESLIRENLLLKEDLDQHRYGDKPEEGMGKVAEMLWASNKTTSKLLLDLKNELSLIHNNNNKNEDHDDEEDYDSFGDKDNNKERREGGEGELLKDVIISLAGLLKVANGRVAKALDNEEKLKEALGRLDAKVHQIISKTRNSFSNPNTHLSILKELLDAKKQTAALAKDNSVGRLARAAAQEQQLEDDLIDLVREKKLKYPNWATLSTNASLIKPMLSTITDDDINNNNNDNNTNNNNNTILIKNQAVPKTMNELQFEALFAREGALRGELQRLKVKNEKLNAAVEERKMVIANEIKNIQERIVEVEKKPFKTEETAEELKAKNNRLKHRLQQSESSFQAVLKVLSSNDLWHVLPKTSSLHPTDTSNNNNNAAMVSPNSSKQSLNVSAEWSDAIKATLSPTSTTLSPTSSSPSSTRVQISSPLSSPSSSTSTSPKYQPVSSSPSSSLPTTARRTPASSPQIQFPGSESGLKGFGRAGQGGGEAGGGGEGEGMNEELRGRKIDRELLGRQRLLSVQRRIGESSDIEHQAMELISQSEDKMKKITQIQAKLNAVSSFMPTVPADSELQTDDMNNSVTHSAI